MLLLAGELLCEGADLVHLCGPVAEQGLGGGAGGLDLLEEVVVRGGRTVCSGFHGGMLSGLGDARRRPVLCGSAGTENVVAQRHDDHPLTRDLAAEVQRLVVSGDPEFGEPTPHRIQEEASVDHRMLRLSGDIRIGDCLRRDLARFLLVVADRGGPAVRAESNRLIGFLAELKTGQRLYGLIEMPVGKGDACLGVGFREDLPPCGEIAVDQLRAALPGAGLESKPPLSAAGEHPAARGKDLGGEQLSGDGDRCLERTR